MGRQGAGAAVGPLLRSALTARHRPLPPYLQINSAPPVPALRLVVIVNLLAEAALLLFHVAPLLAVAAVRRRRRLQRDRLQPELPTTQPGMDTKAAAQQQPHTEEECTSRSSSSSDHGSSGLPSTAQPQDEQAAADTADTPPAAAALEAGSAARRLAPAKSTLRPPVVLARGISRRFESWQQRRPVLHRRLAVAAITVTFMGCCSLQILAPGFVDVSIGELTRRCGWLSRGHGAWSIESAASGACLAVLTAWLPAGAPHSPLACPPCPLPPRSDCCACCAAVQLTTQWTTLGIALAQALLLRQALPRIFWPCAAAMLGGAAMVIAPSVGQSTVGSLNSARGWWGLVMAVGALISTVVYYTLLQVGGRVVLGDVGWGRRGRMTRRHAGGMPGRQGKQAGGRSRRHPAVFPAAAALPSACDHAWQRINCPPACLPHHLHAMPSTAGHAAHGVHSPAPAALHVHHFHPLLHLPQPARGWHRLGSAVCGVGSP